jgi:death-on-curing protein
MTSTEPRWVSLAGTLAIHDRLLVDYGGDAGIRDQGLLESALSAPKNHFHYGENDIFLLAATYANAITQNHPFIDGNKRTAFVVATTFISRNGYLFAAAEIDALQQMLALTVKEITKEQFAEWLRQNSKSK